MSAPKRAAQAPGGKRLPPYGRELRALRMRGLVPKSQIVISLDTWEYGRAYPRVVIPLELDPATLNFDFIAGLDCVLVRDSKFTNDDRRDAVLRELLACNPASLRVIELGDPVKWLWIKSRRLGVEMPEYLK